jgi:acetyl-CoA C-acetyltransferase
MAQASFDAFMLPRHVGLYAGVPVEVPAHQVQRVCGTGIEVLMQAADAVALGRADVALCVGTESMSRNPIAAYTHRGGFRLGQVEFKDFLSEALLDTGCGATMDDKAANLERQYQSPGPRLTPTRRAALRARSRRRTAASLPARSRR